MHEEVRTTLLTCLNKALPVFQSLGEQLTEPYQIWRKGEPGRWHSSIVPTPNFSAIEHQARGAIDGAIKEFAAAFLKHHPEYGTSTVGTPVMGRMKLVPARIVSEIIYALWDRHGTLHVDSAQVEELVNEFGTFVDSSSVHVTGMAQLLNFEMEASTIALPKDVVIRRLTEAEISSDLSCHDKRRD